MDKLSIVIPSAGLGTRIIKQPKALIDLEDGTCILERQLNIINELFPSGQVFITIGFKADKIRKAFFNFETTSRIKFIENKEYEETNVAHSIGLALRQVSNDSNTLIIYGDLVFSKSSIKNIPFSSGTSVLLDNSEEKLFKKDEVGINSINSKVVSLNYGVPSKWSHIMYIDKKDKQEFQKEFCDEKNRRVFGFEVLNNLIDNGHEIKNIASNKVVEIDSYKDLIRANQFIKNESFNFMG